VPVAPRANRILTVAKRTRPKVDEDDVDGQDDFESDELDHKAAIDEEDDSALEDEQDDDFDEDDDTEESDEELADDDALDEKDDVKDALDKRQQRGAPRYRNGRAESA
jgi:hypothetical protein